ncbi:hypothetical protein BC833DRAFT_623360 [Globomyces pollinis-pini]|nr:hypothetical protein BC833DRAFT_623360 [Globomyces pollinis-pini]
MNIQEVVILRECSEKLLLAIGILSVGIAAYSVYSFYQAKKWYRLQLALLLFINGVNGIVNFLSIIPSSETNTNFFSIIANWTQVLAILLYQWSQCELLKLVCVASTFWTVQKVQIYKYCSILLTFIGFMGLLFSRITFQLGDGSALDRWNKIASPIVVAILQLFALAQGIYMTVLMKSICYVKDEKSKINYDKYLKRSYILLGFFIGVNIMGSLLYIVAIVFLRGPKGTVEYNAYNVLANLAIFAYSIQMITLCFLFESIKAMKFGSDSDRRKTSTKEKTRR